jgi:hypothetical protein
MIAKSIFFALLTLACLCQLQAADGMLLDLALPPRNGDRFQHAEFTCWIPHAGKPVKAVIIHQHGCTSASPAKHPPVTGDWHWRALARKHDAALLVPMYRVAKNCDEWNDPESGSERALFTALEDFAQRSKRFELKDAPWVLWGHSGGSSWSAQMIVRHPGRVLAASFRGGCSKQFGAPEFRAKFLPVACGLPLLFVWGKPESVPTSSHFVSWDPMNTMFRELRGQGGKVCRVLDPRSEHGCDDSRFMSINFFDAILSGEAGPGALVNIETRQNHEVTESALRDPALAWVPDAVFAGQWREFSEKGTLTTAQAAAQPPILQAKRDAAGSVHLSWSIVPDLAGGLRAIRVHRDGKLWQQLTLNPADFIATSRDSTPEPLRHTHLSDDSRAAHTYTLTFLDAANRESPSSLPVYIP